MPSYSASDYGDYYDPSQTPADTYTPTDYSTPAYNPDPYGGTTADTTANGGGAFAQYLAQLDSAGNVAPQQSGQTAALAPGQVAPTAPAQGQTQQTQDQPGILSKIGQGIGLVPKGKSISDIDYSDPATMNKILQLAAITGQIAQGMNGPQNKKTPQEMQASLKSPFDQFNATQQAAADQYFNNAKIGHGLQHAHTMQSPIVKGVKYAEGGMVDDNDPQFHSSGALSLVHGHGGGQDDLVPARLAKGEYVMDADIVSALGDGSNERGAQLLDKWREEIRQHKRSTPVDKIPPKAKAPGSYLKKTSA